jgi:hypothetical protein
MCCLRLGRPDHPRTAATNKGLVPYEVRLSFLTFSFDYPTASSPDSVFMRGFLLLLYQPGRCPASVVSMGPSTLRDRLSVSSQVTKLYHDRGSTSRSVAGVHHLPWTRNLQGLILGKGTTEFFNLLAAEFGI